MRDPALAKRALDVTVAATALLLAAPALAVTALAIKLDSTGPVLYEQIRVGRGHTRIRTLKFRTMVVGADRVGPAITAGGDPRITRIGRWLRKTKLDELPQLWNVMRGELSLVGPRPEVPRYVAMYRAEWQKLLDVTPGLTDLASLTFRDEEELLAAANDRERAYVEVIMPLKLQLALQGVDQSSLRFDLSIMLRTLRAILRVQDPRAQSVIAEARRQISQLDGEAS